MSNAGIGSAYIVYTQIHGVGNGPFPSAKKIRSVWRPLFDSKTCFTDLKQLIQHSACPTPTPSKLFVRNISPICFNTRSIRLEATEYDRLKLAEHFGFEDGDYWYYNARQLDGSASSENTSNACIDGYVFGYDPKLEDQRMNYLYFEVSNPLFVRAETGEDARAEGKIFIHIYPSGYLAVNLAIAISWQKDRSLAEMRRLLQKTRPWRSDSRWVWSSRIGRGELPVIFQKVSESLQLSLYVDSTALLRKSPWYSTIKLASTANEKQIADELLMARDNYEMLDFRPGSAYLKSMLVSRQGFACVVQPEYKRKAVLRMFWKVLQLVEFIAFKHQVYNDYTEFLRHQVAELREFRLSLSRKSRKEDLTRFSVYDHKIPQFLLALDNNIRAAKPFHRRIYSAISSGTDFDVRRAKCLSLVKEWEEEISHWEHSLSLMWKKIISPLRSLLGST